MKLFLFLLIITLTACVEDDSKKGRPLIRPLGIQSDETPTPTATATVAITRPTGAVFLQRDFCSCLSGKPDMLGNCFSFCAANSSTTPTLFLSTKLGAAIEANETLGTLKNWCTKQINDNITDPNCVLRAYDGSSELDLPVEFVNGTNNIKVNVNQLSYNKTYVLTLTEIKSGAKSDSVQLRRVRVDTSTPSIGPLKVAAVNQYSCFSRSIQQSGGIDYFLYTVKNHYYFVNYNAPPTLAPGNTQTYCHDIQLYGANDNPLYPRIELAEQAFSVWNEQDIRFFDIQDSSGNQTSNNQLDIHDILKFELENAGQTVSSNLSIFTELTWPNYPGDPLASTTNSTTANPRVGFVMTPWVDRNTSMSYCPTEAHYNSSSVLFQILKEYIGVDTEGLYLAIREPQTITDKDGNSKLAPCDIIMIREGILKKIWFYRSGGLHIKPDDSTVANNTIMFYWPADFDYPYIKKSNQKTYTIRYLDEVSQYPGCSASGASSGTSTTSGPRQTTRPHDRRIACVPKTPFNPFTSLP